VAPACHEPRRGAVPGKTARADMRQGMAVRVPGLSVLQSASVRPSTAAEYEKVYALIAQWECAHALAPGPGDENLMDRILVEIFDEWYLEGESLPLGSKALAALIYHRPWFGRGAGCQLAAARQALRGWKRLEPPVSRLPLPLPVVAMIANELWSLAYFEESLVVMLIFFTYFRPGEPYRLRVCDLVPPVPGAGLAHCRWALTLHAFELGRASKTQEFDESVLLDRDEMAYLGPLLRLRAAGRSPASPLLRGTQATLASRFREACVGLQLECLGPPTLYQLRHSGASADFASNRRTLAEIQRRGRWRTSASVRRYEKGGRVSQQLMRLSPAARAHAVLCGNYIVEVQCGRRSPLRRGF